MMANNDELMVISARDFRVLLACAGRNQASFGRLIGKSRVTVNTWATGRSTVPIEIGLLLMLMASAPDWRARLESMATSSLLAASRGDVVDPE